MEEGVTYNEVETTTAGEETTPTQTTDESVEIATEQTREVDNTPEATQMPQEESVQTQSTSEEEYTPNFYKETEQLANLETQLAQQTQQAQIGNTMGLDQLRDIQILQMRAQLTKIDEERKWEQAFNKHPELKKNKDLDDIVYENYQAERLRNPNITPTQVADKLVKVLNSLQKKVEKETYAKAEDDIAAKVTGSRTPARRSVNEGEVDTSKKAINDYQRTGNPDYLLDLLKY